jgi:hypothetical protein
MTVRHFLLIHGQVVETDPETYLEEAKLRRYTGMVRSEPPTWEEFMDYAYGTLREEPA